MQKGQEKAFFTIHPKASVAGNIVMIETKRDVVPPSQFKMLPKPGQRKKW